MIYVLNVVFSLSNDYVLIFLKYLFEFEDFY